MTNFTHNRGVVFERKSYAGLGRRTTAIVVDVLVLWVAWIAIAYTWYYLLRRGEAPLLESWLSWVVVCAVYLTVLKASRVRTIGYRIAGLRLVDWQGEQPRIRRMLLRLVLCVMPLSNFGTSAILNGVIDFFWLTADPHRQTLRDKLAGTYVVRSHAQPAGSATRTSMRYSLLGLTVILLELKPVGRQQNETAVSTPDSANLITSKNPNQKEPQHATP